MPLLVTWLILPSAAAAAQDGARPALRVGQGGRKDFAHLLMFLYGTGARLLEILRLRVKDIDFQTRELTVRNGKGDHDRATMLPLASVRALREHLVRVRELHDADVAEGFGSVWLPHALSV